MNKSILLSIAAAVAVFASPVVLAEEGGAGKDRAATEKSATKAEKDAAKAARRAQGKDIAKTDAGRTDAPSTTATAKSATKAEKDAAKAARVAAGKQAAKEGSGRLDDTPQGTKK